MDSSFAKSMSLLLLVILSSFAQIQSRESKFFSKVTHASTTTLPSPIEALTPSPTPTAEPATKTLSGQFGPGSGLVVPTKETTNTPTTTSDDDFLDEELASENYQTGYQNDNFDNGYTSTTTTPATNNFNSKQGYQSNNFENGYTTTAAATTSNFNSKAGYTAGTGGDFIANGYPENVNNNEYTSNYNTNGYEAESGRQGMSDTRYLEGGRYFHDVKNNNNYPTYGYEGQKDSATNEGYNGNTQNSNEFNTMEEYYQQNQEQYVP